MNDRLLFLAHTSPVVRDQALFSILTAVSYGGRRVYQIHVYTDAPEAFDLVSDLVEITHVPADTLALWRGPEDYGFRVKALALRDLMRAHPGDRVLYLDADTILLGRAEEVFSRITPGAAVMHEREYNLAASDMALAYRLRRRMGKARFRGRKIELDLDMWNAGAIGLHPAMMSTVEDWVEFIDEVYPVTKKWLVEQLGMCACLRARGAAILPADDLVVHYWFAKTLYMERISALLSQVRGMPLAGALEYVKAHKWDLPRRPSSYGRRAGFFQRVFGW